MTPVRRLIVLIAVWVGFVVGVAADPAAAEAERAGLVTIVDRTGEPLRGGGSEAEFRFELPTPAECPGDSQNGNYRYHTFMIPEHQSPDELTYNGLGPQPQSYDDYESFRMPLYDENTADVTSGLTAEADEIDGPGTLVNLPVLSFDVYRRGEMPLGRYRIGLVCTHVNEPERYWDAVIEVTADESDELAGIAWSVVGAEEVASGDSSSPWPLFTLGGVGALAAVLVLLRFRRTDVPKHTPLEHR